MPIPDLSAYTLHAGHGDCGEQTMLLLTLLRMNGIPARWQSGWFFSRGDGNDIHDWAEIYLAPYGWVPVDVTYGRLGSGDPALKWFYLGGPDNFRIAFNDDFSRSFVPSKRFFRSDDVDSQRGEVESDACPLAVGIAVAIGPVRHLGAAVVLVQQRVVHAQRLEDPFLQESARSMPETRWMIRPRSTKPPLL